MRLILEKVLLEALNQLAIEIEPTPSIDLNPKFNFALLRKKTK